jgi:hypothetical protein
MASVLDKRVRTPVGDAPVVPVVLIVGGLYLCWFAVHYWASDTKWPSDPIKAILRGEPLPVPDRSATDKALQDLQGAAKAGSTVGAVAGGVLGAGVGAVAAGQGYQGHQARQALWTANGGSQASASLAAAISQAENGPGDPALTSHNPDGGTNVGLWQLDTRGVGAGYTVEQLADPNTNARITVMATANGTNWSQWETWHTGAYKQYL